MTQMSFFNGANKWSSASIVNSIGFFFNYWLLNCPNVNMLAHCRHTWQWRLLVKRAVGENVGIVALWNTFRWVSCAALVCWQHRKEREFSFYLCIARLSHCTSNPIECRDGKSRVTVLDLITGLPSRPCSLWAVWWVAISLNSCNPDCEKNRISQRQLARCIERERRMLRLFNFYLFLLKMKGAARVMMGGFVMIREPSMCGSRMRSERERDDGVHQLLTMMMSIVINDTRP